MSALALAEGILLAVGIITVVVILLNVAVAAWVFLWHGIDDYGPLHWKRWRRR